MLLVAALAAVCRNKHARGGNVALVVSVAEFDGWNGAMLQKNLSSHSEKINGNQRADH